MLDADEASEELSNSSRNLVIAQRSAAGSWGAAHVSTTKYGIMRIMSGNSVNEHHEPAWT